MTTTECQDFDDNGRKSLFGQLFLKCNKEKMK